MSRLTRDGTAEPVSRDHIFSGANGDGEILIFLVQLTTSRIGVTSVDPYSCLAILYVMTIPSTSWPSLFSFQCSDFVFTAYVQYIINTMFFVVVFSLFFWCPCMAINNNVSVQYNGGLLPNVTIVSQGSRLNAMKRFCICSH